MFKKLLDSTFIWMLIIVIAITAFFKGLDFISDQMFVSQCRNIESEFNSTPGLANTVFTKMYKTGMEFSNHNFKRQESNDTEWGYGKFAHSAILQVTDEDILISEDKSKLTKVDINTAGINYNDQCILTFDSLSTPSKGRSVYVLNSASAMEYVEKWIRLSKAYLLSEKKEL